MKLGTTALPVRHSIATVGLPHAGYESFGTIHVLTLFGVHLTHATAGCRAGGLRVGLAGPGSLSPAGEPRR
jgi:hypothetical protein